MSHPILGLLGPSSPLVVADDELFLAHVAPPEHPERGARLLAVRAGLARAAAKTVVSSATPSSQLTGIGALACGDATEAQLLRVHDPAYIESIGHLAGRSGFLDSDTYLSPGSIPAARRAAGAAVAIVEALHQGAARSGFAVPRPPGHHALADRAMGFCLLNNVAVGAAHARALGRERVLILDWDVHHGNGTEAIFYEDPSVLFMSLHQYPNYPGTGAATDVGQGDGRGRNVNLPLPPGSTDGVYAAAFTRVVLPIIEQFAPDFALVSCGFDAHARDPLAQMELSAAGFADMTSRLQHVLPDACPLGLVLEGGYDLEALAESTQAVVGVLLGTGCEPATLGSHAAIPEEASRALRVVEEAQAPFWRLA